MTGSRFLDVNTICGSGFVVLLAIYILARLYLLVEVFRTLCFLPRDHGLRERGRFKCIHSTLGGHVAKEDAIIFCCGQARTP